MRSPIVTIFAPVCGSASPAEPSPSHGNRNRPVPADLGSAATGTTAPSSPLFGRALIAVLGSMIFLIVALTVLLVQSTWVHPASAAESPPALDQAGLGGR